MSVRVPPKLERTAVRFDALSLRERGMVGAALLALLIAAWQMLLMDPLDRRSERLQSELQGLRAQITAQDEQGQVLARRYSADPDAESRDRLLRLQTRSAALDSELEQRMSGLIAPSQMAEVLEQVLTRQTELELLSIRSLPPEPLLGTPERPTAGERSAGALYRHGVVLDFRGTYPGMVEYLRALAALPWAFYWDGVRLDVDAYPQARVEIRVYTLGLREGWIGV